MASNEFKKMVELGQWLEKFLDPKIKIWDFRQLIGQGIKLVDAVHPIDYSKSWVGEIEKVDFLQEGLVPDIDYFKRQEEIRYQKAKSTLKDMGLPENTSTTDIQDQKKRAILKELELKWVYYNEIVNVLELRGEAIHLLKKIKKSGAPWDVLFANIRNDKTKEGPMIGRLFAEYTSLTDTFVPLDGKMVKVRTFGGELYYNRLGNISPDSDFYDVFFTPILSNIFLDFLSLGGQDYYLFCEQCGRFTAIQRRGRKKFCSDICRTAYKNARVAEKLKTKPHI